MINFYEFTRLFDDKDSFNYFNSLSDIKLKNSLIECFDNVENYLKYYSIVFKDIFKGTDYDEFYYSCKNLLEDLNNIKIVLNILYKRNNNDK